VLRSGAILEHVDHGGRSRRAGLDERAEIAAVRTDSSWSPSRRVMAFAARASRSGPRASATAFRAAGSLRLRAKRPATPPPRGLRSGGGVVAVEKGCDGPFAPVARPPPGLSHALPAAWRRSRSALWYAATARPPASGDPIPPEGLHRGVAHRALVLGQGLRERFRARGSPASPSASITERRVEGSL